VPVDGCVQRANAGFLAPGQTKLSVCVDSVATGTAVIYYIPLPVPPSGKVWMVTDVSFTHNQTTGQRFALAVGGITVFAWQSHGSTAPDIFGSQEMQPDCPGGLQPSLQILGASSMVAWANLGGQNQNMGAG
jgi:hypothetical protein